MIFADRQDAGRKLAERVEKYKNEDPLVLALPRGGVPVGFEIAKSLDAPLDVLVVRKLGSPINPEFGIGAIAPEGIRILDESAIYFFGLSEDDINQIESKERIELDRRIKKYRGEAPTLDINNKTIILVDDGLATGVSARAAVKFILTKNPKRLVIAIPVCAHDSIKELASLMRTGIDKVECLTTPYDFIAVGQWYKNFEQVTDEEVISMLHQSKTSLL